MTALIANREGALDALASEGHRFMTTVASIDEMKPLTGEDEHARQHPL
jgi:hypothetical protein